MTRSPSRAPPTRGPQGQNLRGKKLNLTVYWKVMPIVGKFGGGSRTFQVPFPLPDEPTARAPNIRTIN